MTTTELREKVNESRNKDFWQSKELTINNQNLNINLKGLTAMYEFAIHQLEGWERIGKAIHIELELSKGCAAKLKNTIANIIVQSLNDEPQYINRQWLEIVKIYSGTPNKLFLAESKETAFLIFLNKKHSNSVKGAFDYLTESINQEYIRNKNYFLGMQLAANFVSTDKGLSSPVKEDISENPQTATIGSYLTEAEVQLDNLLTDIKQQEKDLIEEIAKSNLQRESDFNNWFKETKEQQSNLDKETKLQSESLLKTFKEQMRLAKPAEFWELRAASLKKEGNRFLCFLILLVLFGGFCLYFLLWQTPEGMLASFFNNDKAVALRWSIVFIAFISIIFVGIRYVSKMMFSTFHLARDAEERHQLTHVYLSMVKDASVDEKDRHLIMQSLFSRADTGLLKEDSAPTMPGGIDKIIR